MQILRHILLLSHHYALPQCLSVPIGCQRPNKHFSDQQENAGLLNAGCVGGIQGKFYPKWGIVQLPSSWHPMKGVWHLTFLASFPTLDARHELDPLVLVGPHYAQGLQKEPHWSSHCDQGQGGGNGMRRQGRFND